MSNVYDAAIAAAASRNGVPFGLLKGLVAHESNFNPTARRSEVALADASLGLAQILYGTARGLGYTGTPEGLFDPAVNVNLGAKYFQLQRAKTGSWDGALSAYNGGYSPSLGFGVRATAPGRVCLAKDQQTGACIRWHNYAAGEFGNQPYVDAVLAEARRYGYPAAGMPDFSNVQSGSSSTAPGGPAGSEPAVGALPLVALLMALGLLFFGLRRRQAVD